MFLFCEHAPLRVFPRTVEILRIVRRSSKLVLAALLVAGAATTVWRFVKPVKVDVAKPSRGPAVEAVYATGTVEPSLEIRIAPRAAGRIVELLADEGRLVRKGELLARLDDADLRAQVAELQAQAEYAQSQYGRSAELRRGSLISQDALDRARKDLEAARAALRRARAQLAFMRLEAPVAGRITRRDGEIGELIPVNQTVFYMAGPAPLRITAEVDEEDVPRVAPGLEVLIHTDAFPGRVFTGRVDQVTPRGDSTARSYRVRIGLVDDPPLRIGMTTETNIVIEKHADALLVPTSAVVDGRVWVVEDGHAQPRAVKVGVVGPKLTEIRGGLDERVAVIVDPPEDLEAGARARVRQGATQP